MPKTYPIRNRTRHKIFHIFELEDENRRDKGRQLTFHNFFTCTLVPCRSTWILFPPTRNDYKVYVSKTRKFRPPISLPLPHPSWLVRAVDVIHPPPSPPPPLHPHLRWPYAAPHTSHCCRGSKFRPRNSKKFDNLEKSRLFSLILHISKKKPNLESYVSFAYCLYVYVAKPKACNTYMYYKLYFVDPMTDRYM